MLDYLDESQEIMNHFYSVPPAMTVSLETVDQRQNAIYLVGPFTVEWSADPGEIKSYHCDCDIRPFGNDCNHIKAASLHWKENGAKIA